MFVPYSRQGIIWLSSCLFWVQITLGQRESLPFDYGWKHRTGLTEWAKPNDLPPTNTDPGFHPNEADPTYDDSDWWDVQLPHDGLIVNGPSKEACPDGCSGRSYIPRHVLWYRNTFSLPEDWLKDHQPSNSTDDSSGKSLISMEFEGSFRNTTVWLNGRLVLQHTCGYTPFRIDLDPSLLLLRGGDKKQTVAVFVDPDNGPEGANSHGSGWWYEGGGLYRHVRLVKTNVVHVEPNGLFVKSHFSTLGLGRASNVSLLMEASVVGIRQESDLRCYVFELTSPDTTNVIMTTGLKKINLQARQKEDSSPVVLKGRFDIQDPKMWTSAEPNLYQVDVVLLNDCNDASSELDRVSVEHGIRKIYFDANFGFYLNDQRYKIRGFCDHDTFAVVGMALPDRINLFRVRIINQVFLILMICAF